jgi:hypothetical protein
MVFARSLPELLASGCGCESGGYRRDYLRALAQRVEVEAAELRIRGSKSELLRTLVAASSAKTAGYPYVYNTVAVNDPIFNCLQYIRFGELAASIKAWRSIPEVQILGDGPAIQWGSIVHWHGMAV